MGFRDSWLARTLEVYVIIKVNRSEYVDVNRIISNVWRMEILPNSQRVSHVSHGTLVSILPVLVLLSRTMYPGAGWNNRRRRNLNHLPSSTPALTVLSHRQGQMVLA
jgi:hypothetical protein